MIHCIYQFVDSRNYEIKLLSYHIVNKNVIPEKNYLMYSKKKNLNGENVYLISMNWMHLASLWFAKLYITSITASATNQRTNEFDIALTNTKLLRFFFVIFRSHPSSIYHVRDDIRAFNANLTAIIPRAKRRSKRPIIHIRMMKSSFHNGKFSCALFVKHFVLIS